MDRGDIWKVNFPFGDVPDFKLRPTLVVGVSPMGAGQEQVVLVAMMTSKLNQRRRGDVEVSNYAACGLMVPTLIKARRITHVNPSMFKDPGHQVGRVEDDVLRAVLMKIAEMF